MRQGWRYLTLALLLWLFMASTVRALEVPYLSGRVSDQAGLLSDAGAARISEALQALEQSNGAQVAVLTLASLEGEPLEDYSIRVVESWALGRSGRDDGVLLLVARDDRRIRIEVGYGLEAVLTDAYSRRIIDEIIVPAFRAGNFEAGIEAAVEAMAAAIRGEPLALAEGSGLSADGSTGASLVAGVASTAALVIFLGVFGVILLPFAWLALSLKGSRGWILYLFLAPFFLGAAQPMGETAGFFALAGWLLIYPLLRRIWPQKWQIEPDDGSGGGSRSGRSSSRSSSSSSSSRSSSGSSFSGGGGRFGGGGASGSW